MPSKSRISIFKQAGTKTFSWAVQHFMALFFELGTVLSSLAVRLNFGISLAVTTDFIVDGTVKNFAFFISKIHNV